MNKFAKFCEWNVENYDRFPKTRVALVVAGTIGMFAGIQRASIHISNNELRRRGLPIHD